MKVFRCKKGTGANFILFSLLAADFGVLLLTKFIDVYVILSLIKIFLIILNVYGIYYIFLFLTLKYVVDNEKLNITGLWGLKNIYVPFSSIQGYKISKNRINGMKLFGVGNGNFALGRYVVDKIGTTRIFVTCKSNIIYLKTKDINFAISPGEMERFTEFLREHNISPLEWEYSNHKEVHLHKERNFMIPFLAVSIVVFSLTIIPLIMYVKGVIPNEMPLSFNASFEPAKIGTARQFAFKQMTFGVLNMAVLFCMYYAAHFHAKYDKKSANRYIYISLIISAVFFLMQLRTIFHYIV